MFVSQVPDGPYSYSSIGIFKVDLLLFIKAESCRIWRGLDIKVFMFPPSAVGIVKNSKSKQFFSTTSCYSSTMHIVLPLIIFPDVRILSCFHTFAYAKVHLQFHCFLFFSYQNSVYCFNSQSKDHLLCVALPGPSEAEWFSSSLYSRTLYVL